MAAYVQPFKSGAAAIYLRSQWTFDSGAKGGIYKACPENKDTSRVGRKGFFYAYCGNTAINLDALL
jgi:hypothetical protein